MRTLSNGPVVPGQGAHVALRPLPGGAMRFGDGFWARYQALNGEVTIPHGMGRLEETGSLDNLRIAAGTSAGEYSMPLFRDSDVYKTLEAIAWRRQQHTDPAQERFFGDAVALLREAQQPDGYLNSYVQVVEGGKRFTNPAMGHELYCAGHLIQAAVADLRTGGDTGGLAAVAGRYAGLLTELLPGPLAGFVPGHPEIEMALVELGRATGRTGLITAAADLVGRRGRSTLHWPQRAPGARPRPYSEDSCDPAYFQDDVPFEQAAEVRGHAVRALYLLSGACDVYMETGAEGLLRAALAQWDDMVAGKTYLTGGTGSRHDHEAFGDPYELPPERAYCETCAAIASIMWNWRMLLVTGQARFAALLERTLYNGFLAGLGLDGTSFFYVNPLQTRSPHLRQPWYQCACCPPNIMRLLASLGHYMATVTGTGLQIHQFAAGRLQAELPAAGTLELDLATGYPYQGELVLRVVTAPDGEADVAVRLPDWAATATATLNGRGQPADPAEDHYLHFPRTWTAGDELTVSFPLTPRTIRPLPQVDAVRGCVAFERGPLVYCFEAADLPTPGPGTSPAGVSATPGPGTSLAGISVAPGPGTSMAGVSVAPGATPVPRSLTIGGHPAGPVIALTVPGAVTAARDPRWPYTSTPSAPASTAAMTSTADTAVTLTAIPYYTWANRSPGDMRVWLPER